jgi:uncharacterized iron-regulated protein
MKRGDNILLTIVLILIFCAAVVPHCAALDDVMRVSDRNVINLGQMLTESRTARLFFLAELHDDARHHSAQLAIIKALKQQGPPLAIGLEMFAFDSQAKLDQWVAGKLSMKEFKELYARNWTLPWSLYEGIFLYARNNRIPLIGLNLPQGISRKVAQQGFAALTPEERRQLPPGITCNVGPAYMAFIRQAYANHALQDKAFAHFCEAQMLWNRSMARQLEMFMARQPRHRVVALVGIGHALKKGVPDEVSLETGSYRVVLPETTGLNRNNLSSQDADYLLLFGTERHD